MLALLFNSILLSICAQAESLDLVMASWGPSKHYVAKVEHSWIESVQNRLQGKVQIQNYPDGQLYGPKEMHIAVSRGFVDIGVVLQPRIMGLIPLLQGAYLPFAFDSIEQAATAYSGESRKIIDKALEEKGMKLIYTSFLDGVQLFSAKGNLETIEDFKQIRVLSTSPMLTEVMSILGSYPDTSIPQTEQYMALKRGIADATLNSAVSGYFQKFSEVSPYVTRINMSFPVIFHVMNIDKWNALPEEVQQVMLDEGEKHSQKTLAYAAKTEQAVTEMLSMSGAKVTQFPAEQREILKTMSKDVWRRWADKNGAGAKRMLQLNAGVNP